MFKSRAERAIVWDILYYSLCLFDVFYLKGKEEILNWDVVLVFLPLVLLGISSETFPFGRGKSNKGLKPYCFIDFISKLLAYVWSQLIFRHLAKDIYFWLCLCLIGVSFIVSVVCFVLMIRRSRE